VCPKVEYNSSPGEQVRRLIRTWHESFWEKEAPERRRVKKKTSVFFNRDI
jgi:hypothetical protein